MAILLDGTLGITTPGITNTGTTTIVDLTTTGNTTLGDATTDTLTVGVTGIVKDASGNVGIGTSTINTRLQVLSSGTDNSAGDSITSAIATFTGPNYAIGVASNPVNLQVMSNSTLGADVGASIGLGGRYSTTQFAQFAVIKGAKENATSGQYGTYLAFGTRANGADIAERMRIDSSGNLQVGGTTASALRLYVKGAGTTSASYATYIENSAGTALFTVRNDGSMTVGTAAVSPYNNTTGSAANMVVDSNGTVSRSTSSLKYKKNVADTTHGLAELLALRAVTYKGKSEADEGKTFGGLIAEEVHEAGLTEFVQYAEDGSPDALAYGNMVSLCIKAIQEQQALITTLTTRITALETK